MMNRRKNARQRRWANVVIIVASLYALVMAVWAPNAAGPIAADAEVASHGMWWWTYAVGAPLALSSIFVALKSVTAARILAGAGGLILLAGLATFSTIDWLAIRTLVLPGVAILAATPFMGPMPSPEDEGKPRGAPGGDR